MPFTLEERLLLALDERCQIQVISFVQALQVLLFCGLDLKTGKWNTKQFPVTQTEAQMEGITSDINTYNKSVRDCNKYGEFLSKKYCVEIEIDEQVCKGSLIIFRPPSPICQIQK
jgi:hypothetical protein